MATPPQYLFLVGFMGCGKTTVGARLAALLALPFLDLDALVEAQAGRTVSEIFTMEGEAGFRLREHSTLCELANRVEPAVVATGGGTLTVEANRDLIAGHGLSIWLNPPFATIAVRIGAMGKADRPLFRDEAQALSLFRERLPLYRQADLVADVAADESAEEVAHRLVFLLADRRRV